MKKEVGLLKKIDAAAMSDWIGSLEGKGTGHAVQTDPAYIAPNAPLLRRMTDEDLAELLSRKLKTGLGELAASEMSRREAWRGPGRWALALASMALAVSLLSLIIGVSAYSAIA